MPLKIAGQPSDFIEVVVDTGGPEVYQRIRRGLVQIVRELIDDLPPLPPQQRIDGIAIYHSQTVETPPKTPFMIAHRFSRDAWMRVSERMAQLLADRDRSFRCLHLAWRSRDEVMAGAIRAVMRAGGS